MKSGQVSRRSIRYSVFIGVLVGLVATASGAFADPIEIRNQEGLEEIGTDGTTLALDYILAADIDVEPPLSGSSTYVVGTFTGTLNGNGKTIFGLTKPLFDVIGAATNTFDSENNPIDTVEIKDLNLSSSDLIIEGQGSLANEVSLGGTVENTTFAGIVNGTGVNNVGGLVGENSGSISNSNVSGSVTGTDTVGGLVGLALGDISDSTFSGEVTGERYVGGLVGGTGAPTITNSSASGTVTGINGGEGNIGGLVGGGSLTINNSHADVRVVGGNRNQNIGGLLGYGDASVSISNSYSTGIVSGDINVGGLVGRINGGLISESYSTAVVNNGIRTSDESDHCLTYCVIDNFGGLVGRSGRGTWSGEIRGLRAGVDGGTSVTTATLIQYSYATGNVSVSGDDGNWETGVGGLVGYSEGAIVNSYASGNVNAGTRIGGLVGELGAYSLNADLFTLNPDFDGTNQQFLNFINENGLIKNSFATGKINVGNTSGNRIGGLVGVNVGGKISNSHTTAGGLGIDASGGCDHVGGLVGESKSGGVIENSYAQINGNLLAGCGLVGGLAGSFRGSGAQIVNSYAEINGSICGIIVMDRCVASGTYAGGLVGYAPNLVTMTNSYAYVTGEVYGGSYFGSKIGFYDFDSDGIGVAVDQTEIPNPFPVLPSLFTAISTNTNPSPFAVDECLNDGNPYLIALSSTYESSCSGGGDGGEDIPPPDSPIRERVEREVREVAETRSPEKIEKPVGFKIKTPLPKSAPIAFVETTEKIDLAKVKAVEIAPTANVKVVAKAGEALQISFKSESKEPVELWVKWPDGTWLLAGVITFDENGKAILPPLQFKSAGDYSLILSKPSADSAKGSAPLNQTGSLLVSVS